MECKNHSSLCGKGSLGSYSSSGILKGDDDLVEGSSSYAAWGDSHVGSPPADVIAGGSLRNSSSWWAALVGLRTRVGVSLWFARIWLLQQPAWSCLGPQIYSWVSLGLCDLARQTSGGPVHRGPLRLWCDVCHLSVAWGDSLGTP